LEVPMTILLNDLEHVDGPLALILDDYHVIESQEVHDALMFLIDHLPDSVRLLMTSRYEPPLQLARLRGRRELHEINADDLRFTADEASRFLNDVMGLNLHPDQVHALEERTEGWIAGLLLAALSVEGSSDQESAIDAFTGSHQFVFDYLAEEVLAQQPPEVVDFLVKTSVLDRMSAEIGEVVAGCEDCQEMLEYIDGANLFVIPLDNTRSWFRYHHLFADFLEIRFRRDDPDGWVQARQRAAAWFADRGWWHQAIDHSLACGDIASAAHYIEIAGWDTIKNGRLATLRRWLQALPEQVIQSSVELLLLESWRLAIEREFDGIDAILDTLRSADLTPRQAHQLAAVDVSIARLTNDLERAIELGEMAIQTHYEDDAFERCTILGHLGTAYRMRENLGRAIEVLDECVELAKPSGNMLAWIVGSSQLAVAKMTIGALSEAEEIYRQVLDFEARHGLTHLGFGIASHLGLAETLREQNFLDESEHLASRALSILDKIADAGETGTVLYGYVVLARLQQARGDLNHALEIINEAIDLAADRGLGGWQAERLLALRARFLIDLGRADEAARWMQESNYGIDDDLDFHHDYAYQIVARLLMITGRSADAGHLIGRLRDLARQDDRRRRFIELDALEAIRVRQSGDESTALEHLQQSLALGAADGYIRVFADDAQDLFPLLARVSSDTVPRDYLDAVIRASQEMLAAGEAPDQSGLIEALTERELQVLQLLATGLSNRELADELFLSVGTIKRHTHNIYGKLGVSNRTQALVRGRELGLITD
ncbi:MAG: LuxR C-terminal-related transcriptional regulator, partial [Chloroflexota bacterium]